MTPLDRLRATKKTLPTELREDIFSLGAKAVPELIEILKDEELGQSDSPAEGWPPIHAVDLLVDLKALDSIEPMLDLLAETGSSTIIHDRILLRLHELGRAVLEPALARHERAEDPDNEAALVAVLAELGVKDDRIFDAIAELFDHNVTLGALHFGVYGDPDALPLIEDAIAEFEPDFSRSFWRMDLNELLDAHERLGGTLDDELRARIEGIDDAWARRVTPSRAGALKVGRNDPCPCGSGKKYKKCCIDKARSAATAAPRGPGTSEQRPGGPAVEFVEFARPLLDVSDGSKEATEKALQLAQIFWNIAVLPDQVGREAALRSVLDATPETSREEMRQLANRMISRHRTHFAVGSRDREM